MPYLFLASISLVSALFFLISRCDVLLRTSLSCHTLCFLCASLLCFASLYFIFSCLCVCIRFNFRALIYFQVPGVTFRFLRARSLPALRVHLFPFCFTVTEARLLSHLNVPCLFFCFCLLLHCFAFFYVSLFCPSCLALLCIFCCVSALHFLPLPCFLWFCISLACFVPPRSASAYLTSLCSALLCFVLHCLGLSRESLCLPWSWLVLLSAPQWSVLCLVKRCRLQRLMKRKKYLIVHCSC